MASAVKKCTGLTGLPVAKFPHHTLTILYTKTLKALQKMPENSVYRQSTEDIINNRLNVVKTEKNVNKIEDIVKGGQIEELILQAENELRLARKMLAWKPWEPLVKEAPPKQWDWPV